MIGRDVKEKRLPSEEVEELWEEALHLEIREKRFRCLSDLDFEAIV